LKNGWYFIKNFDKIELKIWHNGIRCGGFHSTEIPKEYKIYPKIIEYAFRERRISLKKANLPEFSDNFFNKFDEVVDG